MENFFPKNDPDVLFYEAHRKAFGYDNDFLLIILERGQGIFDPSFLRDATDFQELLSEDKEIFSVFSPLNQKHLVNGSLGLLAFPLIHVADSSKLAGDSIRIFNNPLYKSGFGASRNSIGIYLTHAHFEDPANSLLLENRIIGLLDEYEFSYRIIGKIPAQNRFISYIQSDFSKFLIGSLIVSFLILLLVFRSWKSALVPFLISLISLVWLFGFAGMFGIKINLLSSLLPPIIFFSSMSDAVHLMNAIHQDTEKPISEALHVVWLPTLLTSVTTAVGFLSLLWINTTPIQYLGLLAALGVLFAFVITFSIGLYLAGSVKTNHKVSLQLPNHYATWLIGKKTYMLAFGILLIVLIIPGIGFLKVDAYLLDDLPSKEPISQHFEFVDREFEGSKPFEIRLEVGSQYDLWDQAVQNEVHKLTEYLQKEYPVGRIQSTSLLLSYLQMANNGGLNEQFGFPEDSINYRKAKRLVKRMNPEELKHIISEDEKVTRIVGFIKEYGSSQTQEKNRILSDFILEELDPSVVTATVTGTTFIIDKSHGLLSNNVLKGLITAILTISFVLGIYFRSLKMMVVSMIPNIIPIALVAGIIGWLGIPLKMTTSIIFTIALGIAVDDTIHMLSSYLNNTSNSSVESLKQVFRHAGSSVLITTVILASGFGIFLFSEFGTSFYMGLFVSLALVLALFVDLTLLPIMMTYIKKDREHVKKR